MEARRDQMKKGLAVVLFAVPVVGLLAAARPVPDSSTALPAEFVARNTTIDGHQVSYRLVDVLISVDRVSNLEAGEGASLVISGAGPFACYGAGRSHENYRTLTTKIPAADLAALVDSLDLSWLAADQLSEHAAVCKLSDPGRSASGPEFKIVVRIGEYEKCLRCASVRSEKKIALPAEVLNFLDQLLHSPAIGNMVSEIGDSLSSN